MRIFLLVAVLLISVPGCKSGVRQILAQVLLTQGNAQTIRQGGTVEKLRPADTLDTDSQVITGPESAAGVSLAPGVMTLLDEQTEMTIDQLEMQKNGGSVEARRARVTLHRGIARFSVGAPPDRRIDLEVVAAAAGRFQAEPGALFSVAVHDQSARITCARGAVRCQGKAGQSGAWIQAGDFLDLGADDSGAQQDEVLAETETQHELATLFVVNARLDELQKAQRSLTPFPAQSR